MSKPILRTVKQEQGDLLYLLERKRVKNLNLRVTRDCIIHVSAPPRAPVQAIDAFVAANGERIRAALREFARHAAARAPRSFASGETIRFCERDYTVKIEEGSPNAAFFEGDSLILRTKKTADPENRRRLAGQLLRREGLRYFEGLLDRWTPVFAEMGVPRPQLRLREMKSRWGSCHVDDGLVVLNTRLLETDDACMEYVLVHELCHFVHPDHSPRFHALMTAVLPDWKARRARLSQSGVL